MDAPASPWEETQSSNPLQVRQAPPRSLLSLQSTKEKDALCCSNSLTAGRAAASESALPQINNSSEETRAQPAAANRWYLGICKISESRGLLGVLAFVWVFLKQNKTWKHTVHYKNTKIKNSGTVGNPLWALLNSESCSTTYLLGRYHKRSQNWTGESQDAIQWL